MSTFKVGEIAIGCNYVTLPDRNGMECEILQGLQDVSVFAVAKGRHTTRPRYLVCWSDGLESWAQPHTLRKPRQLEAAARQAMLTCIADAQSAAKEQSHA